MTSSNTRAWDPYLKRLLRWLVPDQRLANRHAMPPLNAYLGPVRTSKHYSIGDVSVAGFYMITEERWIPGTVFPVTLERTDAVGNGETLTLHSVVVRTGKDGVGFAFAHAVPEDKANGDLRAAARQDVGKLAQFLRGLPLAKLETLERAF
jgi:hypothetical protein